MRVLFFGDGPWAAESLHRLAQEEHDIAGVVVRAKPSDTTLADEAARQNLAIHQPSDVNDPEFIGRVTAMGVDLNISVSYDQILRAGIRGSARQGFINFHAGMLPRYRGRNVINWAIINGEREIGVTAHFVDDGIDTGDIILQRALPIGWDDSYGDVLDRVIEAFPPLVVDAVRALGNGTAVPREQDHTRATYFPIRGPGDEWIDWADTSLNIHNKIRAISRPGPGARTVVDDREVIIWKAKFNPSWPSYIATPGQVVGKVEGEGVIVKTGDSTLLVQEIQFQGEDARAPRWLLSRRLGVNEHAFAASLALGQFPASKRQQST